MRERVLDYEEAVLEVVTLIPAGKVLTYGDIAEILEKGGPRQVGAVMSRAAHGVPWWRVLRAEGRPPQGLEAAAVEHYREESTALQGAAAPGARPARPGTERVDLAASRWNPTPAEQRRLQRIRARLAACTVEVPRCQGPPEPSGFQGLSEPADGMQP